MNRMIVLSKPNKLFVRFKNPVSGFSKKKTTIIHHNLRKNTGTPFIQKVKDLIEENLDDENFGILVLCKAIGLSRAQLHNRIKADTGMSTSIYIRNVRLENAKVLLQNSNLNISEVAYQVGFKCPRYFSTLFLERYQMTPLMMKRMMQE